MWGWLLCGAIGLVVGVYVGWRMARTADTLSRLINLDHLYDVDYGDEETR